MVTIGEALPKITEFLRTSLESDAARFPDPRNKPAYRFEHCLRVTQYGKQIAQAEGARVDLVVAACLLHDVALFDESVPRKDHGRQGAKISRPFLHSLALDPQDVEAICYAVAAHVDDRADFDHPHTLEADCVSDADNLDHFGAYRTLLFCQEDIFAFDPLVARVAERLPRLKEYLRDGVLTTGEGRRMFAQRLTRQIEFFEDLLMEKELTTGLTL